MLLNFYSRYKTLITFIKNWPIYLLNKWIVHPSIYHFVLRKHKIQIAVPKETLRVFKEFFMIDGYSIELLKTYLPKNAVVIDIGANIGLFPIRLLMENADIKFYSYEPLPNNFSILSENVSGNSFTRDRIRIFNSAVLGKKQTDLKIYFNNKNNYTDTSSVIPEFEDNNDAVETACTSLEEICEANQIQKISLLKLDCEGSEFSILYDSPIELINKIPFIVLEIHDIDNVRNNLKGMKDFLYSLGYTLKIKPVTDSINMVWAWK